ncbi:MAG: type II toxin-antitoxin system RelE/ParE family toxin [Azospirillaceae bacterium]|nr:type II toxin-antitoxin system RelE/ParE family toxin [Azospirillaceae bacterium]
MKRLRAHFFRSDSGAEPVREWLLALPAPDRTIVGKDIATVEFGWPVGMPICRALGDGLWEVRSTIAKGKVEARVYFGVDDGLAVLLHAHDGKGKQDHHIRTARKRWAEYLSSAPEKR